MSGIKEVIRVLGFIQEYFDNHANEQEPNERKELFVDWSDTVLEAITLLKAQEPRVMTWDEVKEKIGSGECVFTECEKEGQWMRYGDARLSVDQGDSCRIAFLISRRGDNPYVRWWMIYYENYNKTWRCWTSRPDEKRRAETPWS